jgi:glycosyltransferase involved in cell wall biosynthesis
MRDGRVVLVSDYAGGSGAATGGAGHVVFDSLAALTGYGIDARLIYGFGSSPVHGATGLGGSDLREGGLWDAARTIYSPASRDALNDVLADADRSSTLVILHQWTRYLTPSAIGVLTGFPLMVHLHDHFWACPNGAYYDFPAAQPCDRQPLGPRCVVAQCDRQGRATKLGRLARHTALAAIAGRGNERRLLLHLSERSRRKIAPLLPHERHAIVSTPLPVPANSPAPLSDARYDVGYFGRLEPEKGIGSLIDALSADGRSGLFVGAGTLAAEIDRHPALELRRWQPRETMAAAMRSCRMIVLPSLWPETWGLIVPEAMAAGVPVLVSDRAGSAELVERFGGGAIFDPGTPGDLTRAIAAILAYPPATPIAEWSAFQAALSAERHAARIVTLAAEYFGLALARKTAAPNRLRGLAGAHAPAPRRRHAR